MALAQRLQGDYVRYCAVTIRRFHGEAQQTMVRIERTGDARWNMDSGTFDVC